MSDVLKRIKVGKQTFRNRIMIPAHSYCFPNDHTAPTRYEAYVARRLKNGVGAMVLGESEVAASQRSDYGYGISRYAGTESRAVYERVAKARDKFGGAILEQLYAPGGQVWFDENRRAYAPSQVAHPISGLIPNELTIEQISELIDCFGDAAKQAVSCGLDGIEIKADQGKLHHQFLAKRYNHREDNFGVGENYGEMFLFSTLKRVRKEIGPDPVVGIRLPGFVTAESPGSMARFLLPDISFEICLELAKKLSNEGLVDYISISGETNSSLFGYINNHPNERVGEEFLRKMRDLKAAIGVPLVISGGVETVSNAQELIEDSCADIVGMVRPFIADGDLMAKFSGFNNGAQRRCSYCNIGCVGNTWYGNSVTCSFDPRSGREDIHPSHLELATPNDRLKIAVVGGGPSGLQFACLASELGFRVTIFEAGTKVGGQLLHWSQLDGRAKLEYQVQWWVDECFRLGVSIECGHLIQDFTSLKSRFDLIVDARGGKSSLCDIRDYHVSNSALFEMDPSGKEYVVFGASPHTDPIGLARYLHDRGGKVSLVTPHEFIGLGSDPITMGRRIGWIKDSKIHVEEFSQVLRQGDAVLRVDHLRNTVSDLGEITSIVWCTNLIARPLCTDAGLVAVGEAAGFFGVGNALRSVQDQIQSLVGMKGS